MGQAGGEQSLGLGEKKLRSEGQNRKEASSVWEEGKQTEVANFLFLFFYESQTVTL